MKILVAGSNTKGGGAKEGAPTVSEICKWYGIDKLYSFMSEEGYIRDWDDRYDLMVDSGAHSYNKEDTGVGMKGRNKLPDIYEFVERYFKFIQENAHRKMVFVEFDVYTKLNMKYVDTFCDKVRSMNGNITFMRVYHPVIDNGSLKVLKKWIAEGHEYIGIGNDSESLLNQIFNITRDKIRIHGFAMTKLWMMEKYPFYSVDSTSPLATVIFGRYTTPIMAMKEREDVFNEKSIECFDVGWQRMHKAVVETAITQNYITNLWIKKGVTW